MTDILAGRVEQLVATMRDEHPTLDLDDAATLLVVGIMCNRCGRRRPVGPPYADPPGWMLGEFGADADYCPGCVQ